MRGLRIRPSTCGQYVVSLIGDTPRVLTIPEAEAVRDLYVEKARECERQGKTALVAHEAAGAEALNRALSEASELRRGIAKRMEALRGS